MAEERETTTTTTVGASIALGSLFVLYIEAQVMVFNMGIILAY